MKKQACASDFEVTACVNLRFCASCVAAWGLQPPGFGCTVLWFPGLAFLICFQ